MRHTVRAVAVLVLALGAAPLAAQNPGLPVYNLGVPRGIGIYGDVGFPNDAAGNGTAYGRDGRVGFGDLGATATWSALDPEGPAGSDMSVGGTLNYRVCRRAPGAAVGDAAGRGELRQAGRRIPARCRKSPRITSRSASGFALVIPNPTLAIHPWLAPRVDIAYQKAGGESDTETNFGLSGGLELNLLNGFGIQAAYDRVFVERRCRSRHVRRGRALRVPGPRSVRSRGAVLALVLACLVTGCAQTFDAATLGVPATLAAPAGQPPAGDKFQVSSKAVFGFWGVITIKEPSLRKALASQVGGGAAVDEREDPDAEPFERRPVDRADPGHPRTPHGHLRGGRDEISSASISADRRAAPSPAVTIVPRARALRSTPFLVRQPTFPDPPERRDRRVLGHPAPRPPRPRAAARRRGSRAIAARRRRAGPTPPARVPSAGPRGRIRRRRRPWSPRRRASRARPRDPPRAAGPGHRPALSRTGTGRPSAAARAIERAQVVGRRLVRDHDQARLGAPRAYRGEGAEEDRFIRRPGRARPPASARRRQAGATGRPAPRPPRGPPRCRSAGRPGHGSARGRHAEAREPRRVGLGDRPGGRDRLVARAEQAAGGPPQATASRAHRRGHQGHGRRRARPRAWRARARGRAWRRRAGRGPARRAGARLARGDRRAGNRPRRRRGGARAARRMG